MAWKKSKKKSDGESAEEAQPAVSEKSFAETWNEKAKDAPPSVLKATKAWLMEIGVGYHAADDGLVEWTLMSVCAATESVPWEK